MRARVRMRPLTPDRQAASVPDTPVATDVHETLDVHGHFGAQGTLDLIVALDFLTEFVHVVIGEIERSAIRIHSSVVEDRS